LLSHSCCEIDKSLSLEHNYRNHYLIGKLLQSIYRENNVHVTQHDNHSIHIVYERDTLKNTLSICKKWFQPLVEKLERCDKEKRKEWNGN